MQSITPREEQAGLVKVMHNDGLMRGKRYSRTLVWISFWAVNGRKITAAKVSRIYTLNAENREQLHGSAPISDTSSLDRGQVDSGYLVCAHHSQGLSTPSILSLLMTTMPRAVFSHILNTVQPTKRAPFIIGGRAPVLAVRCATTSELTRWSIDKMLPFPCKALLSEML